MDMKFDLAVANWFIQVADPAISTLQLGHTDKERKMLELLLKKLTACNDSSLEEPPAELANLKRCLDILSKLNRFDEVYRSIRQYLQTKQWISIIIPSGIEPDLDQILTDPQLLSYLVSAEHLEHGLIIQADSCQADADATVLMNCHTALSTALKDSVDWPGVLIWFPAGDSIFLPVGSADFLEIDIEARVQWVFSRLYSEPICDLAQFKAQYKQAFPEIYDNSNKTVHFVHLSDLDIGCDVASHRILAVQDIIRTLIENIGEKSRIIPVITGNLMNNPSDNHLGQVSSFWQFLSGMGTEKPLLVFGNNDVRKDGNINESYRNAVGFQNTKVTWYDEQKVAVISLNTVLHGNLKSGAVGQDQLDAIEYEIERKKNRDDFQFVMLLHHLPMRYEENIQGKEDFYERINGGSVNHINAIEGDDLLLPFVNKFAVTIFLHGYQKIPSITKTEQSIPVLGCGCSIGLKSKYDDGIYFSMNLVSINVYTKKLSSRLLAIRKPEQGLIESKSHEILFRAQL